MRNSGVNKSHNMLALQVLPQCSIAEEKQEEEEEEEEEEDQAPAPAPKAQGGLFGRTQQVKTQPQVGL